MNPLKLFNYLGFLTNLKLNLTFVCLLFKVKSSAYRK